MSDTATFVSKAVVAALLCVCGLAVVLRSREIAAWYAAFNRSLIRPFDEKDRAGGDARMDPLTKWWVESARMGSHEAPVRVVTIITGAAFLLMGLMMLALLAADSLALGAE